MSKGVAVRQAGIGDVAVLAEQRLRLQTEVNGVPGEPGAEDAFKRRCETFFRDTLASGEYVAWIAEEDGVPVGGGGAILRRALPHIKLRDEREIKIQSMYVLPEKRGRGIGGAIMDAILAYLREHNVERITLSPAPNARHFYESRGFHDTPLMRLP